MGILEQIHNLTNSSLPSSHVGYHKFRGIILPTDLFLSGSVRFARKIGNILPTILPNNFAKLYQEAKLNDQNLFLDYFPASSLTFGTRIRVNRREVKIVEDYNPDNNEILLTTGVQATYPENTPIEIYGQPIESDGAYPTGTTTINVDSTWKIYPGDVLVFTAAEIGVTAANLTATVGSPPTYSYQLTLDTPIPYDLEDRSPLLLRAYPAYESEIRVLPTLPGVLTSSGIGPFVLDWVSGPLLTETTAEETMYLQLMTSAGLILEEGIFSKNDLVLRAPLQADYPLFWDIGRGKVNWDGSRFQAYTDDKGKFHIFKKLVPTFPTDQVNQWNIQVEPDLDVNLFVQLDPNTKQSYSLTGGVISTINVLLNPTDSPAERIHIWIDSGESNPNTRIRFNDWNPVESQVETVKYTNVTKVVGRYNYAVSGLFVKPMFQNIDSLKIRLDYAGDLDGGRLVL